MYRVLFSLRFGLQDGDRRFTHGGAGLVSRRVIIPTCYDIGGAGSLL